MRTLVTGTNTFGSGTSLTQKILRESHSEDHFNSEASLLLCSLLVPRNLTTMVLGKNSSL